MRITYFIITLAICFCMSLHAENKANDYMKQAQSSLEQRTLPKPVIFICKLIKPSRTKGTIHKPLIAEQKRRIFTIAKTIIRKHSSFAGK